VSVAERVREIVEPLLADRSLEVIDVELNGSQLRVTVDRAERTGPDSGVDLDALSDATRVVSHALDELDPVPGRYTLEVSSPGLERTLRTPVHYRHAIGETLRVKLRTEVGGVRRVQGELTEADDDGITVDGHRLSYADIDRARTVFEWGPAPKPGKSSPGKSKVKTA
jgi:ribosome maturation factor RimP